MTTSNLPFPPSVHLDLDGVLADFDEGLRGLGFERTLDTNRDSSTLGEDARRMKRAGREIVKANTPGFYRSLPLLPGAHDIWAAAQPFSPVVVTAIPGFEGADASVKRCAAAADKFAWINENLGPLPADRFIAVDRTAKADAEGLAPGDPAVLVDDREDNCERWRAAGGLALLHRDPAETVRFLNELSLRIPA